MNEQLVITKYFCRELPGEIAVQVRTKRLFAVCEPGLLPLERIQGFLRSAGCACVFSEFRPNPSLDSVMKGRDLFEEHDCGAILAVGGGSAIDVAKCIKYNAHEAPQGLQEISSIKLIAVPTTAGTGSEATRFAVVYSDGEKQSIERDDLIPEFVVLDSSLLETLPAYQRRSTAFDALCHAIESLWSVNSTRQSRCCSIEAIRLFFAHYKGYIDNARADNDGMLQCANTAGKAINIAKTTAAHAMSYKISALRGIPHGHSAAVCLPGVWKYIADNSEACGDPRGKDFLRKVLDSLNESFGFVSDNESIAALQNMIDINFPPQNKPFAAEEIDLLSRGVNLLRLKNSPVPLDSRAVESIYKSIVL